LLHSGSGSPDFCSNSFLAVQFAASVVYDTVVLTRRQDRLRADAAGLEVAEAKTALSMTKADFDARQEELRKFINEARERENEAKTKAIESDQRYAETAAELRITLEEKGQFQNEATRVEETKAMLLERDAQIQSSNARIMDIEREKTEVLKDAEAANKRATDSRRG
jgi:hypothetical protein